MTCTMQKVEITRFYYRQERGDKDYGTCLWSFFDVNAPEGTITIQGDRGHYAYTWPEKSDEFWKLCARMDGEYMIHKMMRDSKKKDAKLAQIWDDCVQPEIVKFLGGDA